MLCTNCKKNQATLYYKQNINGKVTQTALCPECAKKLGAGSIIDKMFDGFSLNPFAGFFGIEQPVSHRSVGAGKRCPLCGSAFEDIVESGKLGCAKCYETFAGELAPTISNIHGKAEHNGRAPKNLKAKNEKRNKLRELKTELKKAVDEQDFEHAAALRDAIKAFGEN